MEIPILKLIKPTFSIHLLSILIIIFSHSYSQHLKFEQDTFDFGKLHYKPGLKRYLNFINTSSDTIKFLGVPLTATGFDVASTVNNKMSYAPGEYGTLIYHFESKKPGNYHKTIKIVTNLDSLPILLFVQWEILPDIIFNPIIDKLIPDKERMISYLRQIEHQGCYGSLSYVYSHDPYESRQAHYSECDTLRNLAIQSLNKSLNVDELFKQACSNENEIVRLVCLETISRFKKNSERIESIFEAEYLKTIAKPSLFGTEWAVYYRMLDIVSPQYSEFFPISNKLDLQTYVYLASLPVDQTYTAIGEWKSFSLVQSALNYGTIDLTDYSLPNGSFVIRGKIHVKNTQDHSVVVAPYHDGSTWCDQKSYRIPPNEQIDINFWTSIRINEMNNPIHRVIHLVDYNTKEKQLFNIEAKFENF